MTPVKYVMSTTDYTSGAMVCVYNDGSVLVSHGGCEIGQGINTKVALCAARTLGIPLEKIAVGPTETSKVPNNSGTGGSGTSECSSEAAILACEQIVQALQPYCSQGVGWEDAVQKAQADGVNLMQTAWYQKAKTANANAYATYGVGVSEVQVDLLTGQVWLER